MSHLTSNIETVYVVKFFDIHNNPVHINNVYSSIDCSSYDEAWSTAADEVAKYIDGTGIWIAAKIEIEIRPIYI